MKYLFFTDKGFTLTPLGNDIENLQILGEADGTNFNEAYINLVNENPWITEEKYGEENIYYKMLIDDNIVSIINVMVNYNWHNEEKHFYEMCDNCNEDSIDHIFKYLKKLQTYFNIKINK